MAIEHACFSGKFLYCQLFIVLIQANFLYSSTWVNKAIILRLAMRKSQDDDSSNDLYISCICGRWFGECVHTHATEFLLNQKHIYADASVHIVT